VLARCVEDYTQLTRRSSENGALSEDENDAAPPRTTAAGQKIIQSFSWPPANTAAEASSGDSLAIPETSGGASPRTRKTISFSDAIMEDGEEEEKEDDEDIGEELRKKLGKHS
jgi:hypothetical protein